MKVAVTDALAFNVIWQVDEPLHAPDQPANTPPPLGAAVSVITVPPANVAVQVEPQLIPAGLLETVPVPEPTPCTVS